MYVLWCIRFSILFLLSISQVNSKVFILNSVFFLFFAPNSINKEEMDILSIENITKNYAAHTAINDVSMVIPQQSVFGLLGPNGAGKTSLIRIINQITAPDKGRVLFNGNLLEPKHTEMIGYMPEERGLYKKMEVGEQALYLSQL